MLQLGIDEQVHWRVNPPKIMKRKVLRSTFLSLSQNPMFYFFISDPVPKIYSFRGSTTRNSLCILKGSSTYFTSTMSLPCVLVGQNASDNFIRQSSLFTSACSMEELVRSYKSQLQLRKQRARLQLIHF